MKVYAPSPEELAAALDVCFWCRKVLDSVIRGQPVEPEHFISLCADLRKVEDEVNEQAGVDILQRVDELRSPMLINWKPPELGDPE
jgi:hypothetical protein